MFLHPQSVQSRSTWESLKRMVGFGKKTVEEKGPVAEKLPLTIHWRRLLRATI